MKETVKTFVIVILVILVVFLSIKTEKCHQEARKQPEPKTIIITDTLTNVVYDTVFFNHFETVKLQVVDTIVVDSLRIDSVFVEVPISIYKLDTTFTTDTTSLNIRIQNLGYNVKLDSLYYRLEYTPTKTKTNFFKDHFRFGLGIGTGYGCFTRKPDVFLGFGVYYCF